LAVTKRFKEERNKEYGREALTDVKKSSWQIQTRDNGEQGLRSAEEPFG